MSTSEERGRIAKNVELSHQQQVELAQILKEKGYSNSGIAHIMRISESSVRSMLAPLKGTINWRQNCLTTGPHDGRPEAIWNISLLQTTLIFSPVQLQQLVVDRIYNDAMQFVEHSPFAYTQKGTDERAEYTYTQEWAEKVKEVAGPRVLHIYQQKVGELTKYYRSSMFKNDLDRAIGYNKEGKLNPHYEPLHSHDTINMLCRIVGVGSLTGANK